MVDTDVGFLIIVLSSWALTWATFYFADRQANKKRLDKDK
tara:strand:+ start:430 stop:549 length:120 start_codon:yes stop_codon:yes gene_type:complete